MHTSVINERVNNMFALFDNDYELVAENLAYAPLEKIGRGTTYTIQNMDTAAVWFADQDYAQGVIADLVAVRLQYLREAPDPGSWAEDDYARDWYTMVADRHGDAIAAAVRAEVVATPY